MTIEVRLDNESGTVWTLQAKTYRVRDDCLQVVGTSGKEWSFPLRHVLWWNVIQDG